LESNHRYREGISDASLNAERAFHVAFSPEYAHYPRIERQTWAAAAILQCDILRYLIAFENETREGLARLLWMGDIVSMLFEAKIWFQNTGNKNLIEMATSKGLDTASIQKRIKEIKKSHPLSGIDDFTIYRNKAGHHYDPDFVEHVQVFSETDSDNFYNVLTNYAKFSQKWLLLCKEVLAHSPPPKA
jgi:hypothetical protein